MQKLRCYILIFLALFLAGCATVREQPALLNQPISWQERSMMLAQLHNWNISAIMAIQTHTGTEGGTANLKWQQYNQNYNLLLYGPLGADAVKITGQPGHVSLETADGKKFTAATPELLLAQQTGWRLPVSDLYYWIRGLPTKGPSSAMQFDLSHRLTHLDQAGWTIDFLRYSTVNQMDLPTKLTLATKDIKVKIIINQWQI